MPLPEKDQNRQYQLALLIFLFLHVGLFLELLLIGHYESFWQLFPLISLGLGLVSLFPGFNLLLPVKFFYLVTIVSGVVGIFLHLKSNWEFEFEMYDGIGMMELTTKSFSGALPVLAPGTLIPVGLMGFHLLQLKSKDKSK
ncbi:MAG: hypothetical protein GDA42_05545 [Ekhidna sp.]|nr:hypothetical protein [Ekhidna sp.]